MISIGTVAHYLQLEAIRRRSDASESDVFGRSAFNRYYYATYLCARQSIARLNPRWGRLPHADFPQLLKGEICKKIRSARIRAQKIGDQEMVELCSKAIAAARELAELMLLSSSIRVIADYRPEILVDFPSGDRFSLNGVAISAAHNWPDKAISYSSAIESAWMQLDGY